MVTTPRFRPARPRRAFDEITSQVREMVRRGELSPGDRLPSERALAEQFLVSRNTVREAMRMLEVVGLVELRRGATGGAFIAQADPRRVAVNISDMLDLSAFSFTDLAEARLEVESSVIRLACERRDDDDLAALEANIALAVQLTAEGQFPERASVHVEFDNLLASAAKNPVLIAFMRSISTVSREVVNSLGVTQGDIVVRAHRAILKHVRSRDADAAVAELKKHVTRIHKHWVDGEYSRKMREANSNGQDERVTT
jgi:GntR family transcriptional regulator, transcriptional repressor for pyruvate dehydrogenase complex